MLLGLALRDRCFPEMDALESFRGHWFCSRLDLSSGFPSHAARATGTEPNQAARSPCKLGVDRVLEPLVSAIGVRGVHMHHGRIGPARRTLLGHDAGNGLRLRPQDIDLERPGGGGHDTFVGEVVDLHEGVMPVAADNLPLLPQERERRLILILGQVVGILDAEVRFVDASSRVRHPRCRWGRRRPEPAPCWACRREGSFLRIRRSSSSARP